MFANYKPYCLHCIRLYSYTLLIWRRRSVSFTLMRIRYIDGILDVPMMYLTEISVPTTAHKLGLEVDLLYYSHREVCDAKASNPKVVLWR